MVGGLAFLARLIWFKPDDINSYVFRFFLEHLSEENSYLSEVRPPFLDNFSGYDADFSPLTESYLTSQQNHLTSSLETLETYPYAELAIPDQTTFDVLRAWMQRESTAFTYRDFHHPFNPYDGIHLQLMQQMLLFNPILNREASDDYISRMRHFEDQFRVALERSKSLQAVQKGMDGWSIDRSLRQIETLIEQPIQENPLYLNYARKARQRISTDPTELNELVASDYLGRVETTWNEYNRPALEKVRDWLKEAQDQASDAIGLADQPEGAAYFQWRLQSIVEYEGNLDSLGKQLNREFARLQDTLQITLDKVEIAPSPMLGERVENFLETGLPDSITLATRSYLKELRVSTQLQSQYMSGLVNDLPPLGIILKDLPPIPHGTAPVAKYVMPSLDDSRPAWMLVQPDWLSRLPVEMQTVWVWKYAYPGKQFARAMSWNREDLEGYRHLLHFPAFSGGWRMYSGELVEQELLLLETSPRIKAAFYLDRIFDVALALAEIDFHQGNLSLAESAEWILGETGIPDDLLEARMFQVIHQPGLALAPFVGQAKIRALRTRAKATLGDQFYLQDFHEILLQNAEIPLIVLEKKVNSWLEQKLAN